MVFYLEDLPQLIRVFLYLFQLGFEIVAILIFCLLLVLFLDEVIVVEDLRLLHESLHQWFLQLLAVTLLSLGKVVVADYLVRWRLLPIVFGDYQVLWEKKGLLGLELKV
jgi:hypothetical protein